MKLPGARAYPRRIHIKDDIWEIKFRRLDFFPPGEIGYCDPSTMEIGLCLGMNKKETFQTFVHELIHAIEYSYNFQVVQRHVMNDNVYKITEGVVDILTKNF